MKRVILVMCFLYLSSITTTIYAQELYWYPEGRWSWPDKNIAYILKEYDQHASRPGCIEWLDKTGFIDATGKHYIPMYIIISAAIDAKWGYSLDYTKPKVNSIVYWDINPGTQNYSYAMAFVRNIDGDILTLEYWDTKTNGPMQYQRKTSSMRMTPSGKTFRGYIYPDRDKDVK